VGDAQGDEEVGELSAERVGVEEEEGSEPISPIPNTEAGKAAGDKLLDELDEFCQALPPGSHIELRGASGFTFHYVAGSASANDRTLRRHFMAGAEQFDLEVGVPSDDALHTLALLRLLLLSLTPVVVAIAGVGGYWLSGRALKPVHDITAAALTISIENLSGRLPVPPTGDELARLTEVLNTMFQRLESAVKTLSRFVADASHELRTPLAVIRTTAELALRRDRRIVPLDVFTLRNRPCAIVFACPERGGRSAIRHQRR